MRQLHFGLSIVGFLFSSIALAGTHFGLNDVSILLPLPSTPVEMQELLAPSSQGRSGPLIEAKLLNRLPNLIVDDGDHAARLRQLRVVGVRFDPCFTEGEGPVPCRRQIRLVLQPISFFQNDPMTFDAAMHVFYDFTADEWKEVVAAWKATLAGNSAEVAGLPLQIHPAIRSEGLKGAYWNALKALILRFCDSSRTTRLTVSSVNTFGTQWAFQGFDVVDQGDVRDLRPIVIPRTDGKAGQVFVSGLRDVTEFNARILPDMEHEPQWPVLMRDSVLAKRSMSATDQLKAMERAFEFENPERFNTSNLDCASCHVAQTVRLWGERHIDNWWSDPGIQKAKFVSRWNLENKSVRPYLTNRVRAFGYFVDEPLFSQRVINETAAVADLMARY